MSAKWWYRRQGRESGPVSREELKRLAGRGAVGPGDLVRAGEAGDWVAFEASGLSAGGASSDAAARILAQAPVARLTGTPQEAGRPRRTFSAASAVASVAAVCGDVVRRVADLLPSVPANALRFVGGAVLFLAAAAVVWRVLPERSPSEEAYAVYQGLVGEISELRRGEADESAWRRIRSDVDAASARLVPRLTRAAESGDAAALELLRVGRDHLPRMAGVGAAAAADPGDSDAAEFHLDRARRFLRPQGRGGAVPGWVIAAVLAFDGVAAAAAVAWVVRDRRARGR